MFPWLTVEPLGPSAAVGVLGPRPMGSRARRVDLNTDRRISAKEMQRWIMEKTAEHFQQAVAESKMHFSAVDPDGDGAPRVRTAGAGRALAELPARDALQRALWPRPRVWALAVLPQTGARAGGWELGL